MALIFGGNGIIIRIIGIDPGLRSTGWGVIESDGIRLSYTASGTVRPRPDLDLATRLHRIFDGLTGTIAEFSPQEAAVEVTFVNKNPASTLKLGQARGIAMLAPATTGISVSEYEPTTVKKTVTGGGRADKQQIRGMIGYLLPQAKPDSDDAADALAIAITHAHNRNAAILQRNTLAHAC